MTRPNFIFILADDLGYADLGCTGARDEYNNSIDVSPVLDRLAAGGLRFTRGYANSAVCSPTRFALATGRWQYRLRGAAEEPIASAHGDKVIGLPPSHPSLASLLKDAGYATALVGKWHLGHPPHFGPRLSGYDEFYGFHAGGADYFAHCDPRGKPDLWRNETPIKESGYLTDMLSTRAAAFVRAQSAEKPFFLSLHYSAPHWPWLTRDDQQESVRIGGFGKHVDGGSISTYQCMIHHMDEGIGWVLDALRDKGLDENTLIVFTSDNGGERFSNNWPFVGQKMDLLEGGIRVPLIANWPAQIDPGICDLPNMTMDWTATLLDAAGVCAHPEFPLDGKSLMPSIADGSGTATAEGGNAQLTSERELYWRMKHRSQRAVIKGSWKYLQVEGIEYLLNLSADPRERANLRDREPNRLVEMRESWLNWNESMPPIPEDAKVSLIFTNKDLPQATF